MRIPGIALECYYKRTVGYHTNPPLIKDAITDCFQHDAEMTANRIKRYSQEILSLRNHYTHRGYYLSNCSLEIKSGSRHLRTVRNINYEWLEKRTDILGRIVIDIVFRKMLGYSTYKYTI